MWESIPQFIWRQEMNRIKEITDDNKKKSEERREARSERTEGKRDYKLEKIKELTAKAYAVASKRKWLVFMIVAAIAAYLIIFKGGFSFGGGWLDKIKGLF